MTAFPILVLAFCDAPRALSVSGVIARLKAEAPQARITLATTPAVAALFEDDDSIAEIQALDGAIFNLKSLGSLSELSRRNWGLCIDLGPSLIARMMKARIRFTFNPNDTDSALTQLCDKLALNPAEVMPRLAVSPNRAARARTLLDASGRGGPLICMAPGAGWLGRRWPTERFAVLATRLTREDGPFPGHRLLVVGDEVERDTLMALALATPRAQVLETRDGVDILTLYAALRQAQLFIGNDEIWLHLSAAAGVPTFGLFGPSSEAEAPPGSNVQTVRGQRTLEQIRLIDPKLKQNVCHMLDLPVDRVYEAITKMLQPAQESPNASDI
jgi:ADP-heptose:LPS heptosyltransferase